MYIQIKDLNNNNAITILKLESIVSIIKYEKSMCIRLDGDTYVNWYRVDREIGSKIEEILCKKSCIVNLLEEEKKDS